jgi:hypothetical protein
MKMKILVLFVFFISILCACSEVSQSTLEEELIELKNIEYPTNNNYTIGQLDERNYSNSFFQFSIHIPDSFVIISDPLYAEVLDDNKEVMGTKVNNE